MALLLIRLDAESHSERATRKLRHATKVRLACATLIQRWRSPQGRSRERLADELRRICHLISENQNLGCRGSIS